MATMLEVYEINTKEEFEAALPVMIDAYTKPFNTLYETIKGPSDDEFVTRFWHWHTADPGSQWIGVRKKDGDKATVGVAEWVLHESNPFEQGNPLPPVDWWSDVYTQNVTEQVVSTFFGGRPKVMSRPHVLLNICCVAPDARRQGAGRLLMNWGRSLADQKGLETFIEATIDGVRLYESTGFTQVEPIILDAKLPEKFKGEDDKKAWLEARHRVLPRPFPVMLMWRPKGADWKEGDEFHFLESG